MTDREILLETLLRLGDTALIASQRLCEWMGKAPELEEEMAIANFALDHVGQARMLLGYAGEVEGKGRDEDKLAYHRDAGEFRNVLLAEQPDRDYAFLVARQFLLSTYLAELFARLAGSSDRRLAEIAQKAVKEAQYHARHCRNWVVRLGDGTEESHARIAEAVETLWTFTGELFEADEVDDAAIAAGLLPPLAEIRTAWEEAVSAALGEATLTIPENGYMARGGKTGRHTEAFGHMLAEMQILPRSYPGAEW